MEENKEEIEKREEDIENKEEKSTELTDTTLAKPIDLINTTLIQNKKAETTNTTLANNKTKKINQIVKKVTIWLKNPLNFSLAAVLVFAISIRLYFFFLVGNQPLWWDETAYGSLAKNFISHQWDGTNLIIGESAIRPLLFPIMWAALLFLKIPETGVRFLLEFVPSILSVFFVYLIGKEIFNKRTGIISAFLFSVLWIHLFYTVRLLTNIPAMVFLFSSIYFFIRANKKEFNYKLFSVSLILLSVSSMIRYPNGLIFFVYLFILILSKRLYLNKKKFWIAGIIGISPILIFFLLNFIAYGNIFPALLGGDYLTPAGAETGEQVPFNFKLLNFIPTYLKNIFFIFFILGSAILLFELLVGYNFILKNRKLINYLLLILILLVIYSFFIFYLKEAEDRWLFATSLPICCLAGFGLNFFYKFIKKYNKYFAIFLILTILILGANSQLTHANSLIKDKKQSFLEIRQGFEWIKENTPKNSAVMAKAAQPYIVYYSERTYLNLPDNRTEIEKTIDQVDYLVIHSFAEHPQYVFSYLEENQEKLQPLQAFYFDAEQKQLALMIFENKKETK